MHLSLLVTPTAPTVGIDGVSPVIAWCHDERRLAVVAWHRPHPLVTLPVVTLRCFVCMEMIPAGWLDSEAITVSRVGGDSANGYEAYHAACL